MPCLLPGTAQCAWLASSKPAISDPLHQLALQISCWQSLGWQPAAVQDYTSCRCTASAADANAPLSRILVAGLPASKPASEGVKHARARMNASQACTHAYSCAARV